jgi:tetrahedral aminopeptidase
VEESRQLLRTITSMAGVSGYEKPVREVLEQKWRPLVDEMHVSNLGSLHALKRGTQNRENQRKRIMLAAHMDAIGLMVTKVVDGYLRFTSVGGFDARLLPYQPVIVHGKEPIKGIIAAPLERHMPEKLHGKSVPMEYLYIDTGLSPEKLAGLVKPGDIVSLANEPIDLDEDTIAAHTLDDRGAVAAVNECLQILAKRVHAWDVVAVATTQEEVGLKGAFTSGFAENPDLAIVIDMGFAKEPGASGYYLVDMGEGPCLAYGPVLNYQLYTEIEKVAKRLEIPYHKEINPGGRTGTDSDAITLTREGIPTALLSIPLRYMHSPYEIIHYDDMERTGRLLAEFICSLDMDFMEKLSQNPASSSEEK